MSNDYLARSGKKTWLIVPRQRYRVEVIRWMRPRLSYLICATPRSGSMLLCEALGRAGIAGNPAEHFEVLLETGRPRRPAG